MDTFFSMVSFLVSSSHETFVEESRWFWGGAIVESVPGTDNSVIVTDSTIAPTPKTGDFLFNERFTRVLDPRKDAMKHSYRHIRFLFAKGYLSNGDVGGGQGGTVFQEIRPGVG